MNYGAPLPPVLKNKYLASPGNCPCAKAKGLNMVGQWPNAYSRNGQVQLMPTMQSTLVGKKFW